MAIVVTNGEKQLAVTRFHVDDTYSTCSQRNKAADSAGFFIGEEVTIQWSKHEVYKGIVAFTDDEKCIELNPSYNVLRLLYYIT